MKKTVIIILLGLAGAFSFQNCKHELPFIKIEDNPVVVASDTCSADTLYFVNDILPIILSNCAKSGCHDASSRAEGVVLTDYANIMNTGRVRAFNPNDSKLYKVMVKSSGEEKMPPPPASMTPEQINAIKIWINQGALNNKCENKCDTSNVAYAQHIWPIMESTCKGCHTGSSAGGGIKITNYNEVKAIVSNGKLDGSINHRSGFIAMPQGGKLEQCALDKIRIWIEAGAPNN